MSNIRVVNLSTYTAPKITEEKNKDFVSYGQDNNYYQYLIDQYQGSPTNNAIINGITEMIYGKGLSATNSDKKPMEYAEAITLFNKDELKKICSDFYLLGQATLQVYYNVDRSKIVKVEHFPVQTLRAEKADKKGDIKGYYYFHDWSKYTNRDKLTRIPAFGSGNNAIEILCIKPYRAGYFYYTPVTYQGALPYCELEAEVANYHINNIQNGMAPSMLVNFNNGTPDEEARELIEKRIYEKFSGSSNAGKFILAFNDNQESAATIDPVQLSDAHNQYQFLSDESTNKILVGHRLSSPLLLGIRTGNNGLGSNADELKQASILFDNMVVRVQQEYILDALDKILAFNNISLNLYFKTLQPLEFTDLEGNIVDDETREEETGVDLEDKAELSSDKTDLQELLDLGKEEDLDNWELIESAPVDYDNDEELNLKLELTSTGSAKSNAKSKQDGENKEGFKYKVRYKYMPEKFDDKSREFCRKMIQAKKIYRKEDIMAMSSKSVNPGWGPDGANTYDIWLYKGGGSCRHYWERRVYMAKTVTPDAKNPRSEISVNEAKKQGFKPETNDAKVAKRPRDMKNRGFKKKKDFTTPKGKAF
tara:strand:- start:3331 stop:5106 length:1776 start_codon:yes stop_codon:yes gene_type:complete